MVSTNKAILIGLGVAAFAFWLGRKGAGSKAGAASATAVPELAQPWTPGTWTA